MLSAKVNVSLEVLPQSSTRVHRDDLVFPKGVCLFGDKHTTTAMVGVDAPEREALIQFVQFHFKRAYQAEVRHVMPQLMSIRDASHHLMAVCGLRHAGQEELFLEQYFSKPVEQLLANVSGIDVARHEVVEVGNLAVASPRHMRHLLSSVSAYLHSTGAQWAVFTVIPSIRHLLTHLNMELHVLGEASLAALPIHTQADWGTYYDCKPQVIAVRRQTKLVLK